MARNGRSSSAQSRSCLELAARARPGAAAGSKWPLRLGPAPQLLARHGRSSRRNAAIYKKMLSRVWHGLANCSKFAACGRSNLAQAREWIETAARPQVPRAKFASCMHGLGLLPSEHERLGSAARTDRVFLHKRKHVCHCLYRIHIGPSVASVLVPTDRWNSKPLCLALWCFMWLRAGIPVGSSTFGKFIFWRFAARQIAKIVWRIL